MAPSSKAASFPGSAAQPTEAAARGARSLRQRIDAWFLARRPPSDQITLTQRNVYILPTRAGLMLGITLAVLLLASINYQLNLGYLLTFLLAGCAAVGMQVCHGTLRGLDLHLLPPEPQYAGSAAVLRVVLHNARRSPRFGIGLAVHGLQQRRNKKAASAVPWAWTDVPGQGQSTVEVAFQPPRRGWQAVPALTAETRFPLGTFRVWTVWRPASQVLVYPQPEPHPPPLPAGQPRGGPALASASTQGAGEYDGVRAYRRGDPLKLVVWKKAARAQAAGSQELVSRDAAIAQRHELWLDLASAGLPDAEARLSRLTAWVLQADRLGLDYGLDLGARQLRPAQGEAHRRACLEMLATA
ncbi:DUF58 domain-containing protein [Xenophilus sp. Marseille-Q4582]|uniref:DUF58 domain-containing protein n=1 Tax=Xenophilus sp. Marseille-Q4582 TaxID=2866600 RepID=UPI001CE40E50|nr:DUF58 domain-containing protein [Xenophilus sp. Marseille-Q4582]